jgi:tRNA nucleotidyltransferase (CCA-adding enzyme)
MQIYLVGGAVRDRLLGLPVKDRDWVVVGATPRQMLDAGFKPVGRDFPVFIHPDTGEEYALARTERKSGKGYTGFEFHASPEVTLEEDLRRRDLTINAMAEAADGQIIDPYGGRADLEQRLLRHVSPAFAEDPLRVLRVARFAARFAPLGFAVANDTLALMRQLSAGDELEHLSAERVWQEFERALATAAPLRFISLLEQVGAGATLLPELCRLPQQAHTASARLCAAAGSAEQQFALLLTLASAEQSDADAVNSIESLCARLRVPNRYRDLALQLRRWHRALIDFADVPAATRLQLIRQLDLLRRPERLALIRPCVAALYGADRVAPELEPLLEQLNALQPRALMQQGFKGKALGEELERRQLALCAGRDPAP